MSLALADTDSFAVSFSCSLQNDRERQFAFQHIVTLFLENPQLYSVTPFLGKGTLDSSFTGLHRLILFKLWCWRQLGEKDGLVGPFVDNADVAGKSSRSRAGEKQKKAKPNRTERSVLGHDLVPNTTQMIHSGLGPTLAHLIANGHEPDAGRQSCGGHWLLGMRTRSTRIICTWRKQCKG